MRLLNLFTLKDNREGNVKWRVLFEGVSEDLDFRASTFILLQDPWDVGRSNFINHKLSNYMCQFGLLLELSMRRVCIKINLSEVITLLRPSINDLRWIES